jgi:5-methylcytosine-specific restriction enzyme A
VKVATMSAEWHHLYCSAHWQRRRGHQLREHPLCRFCLEGRGQVEPATIADHIEPHHGDRNKFFTGELQSLCERCHKSRKRFIEINGYDPIVGLDGWPLDKLHPANRVR